RTSVLGALIHLASEAEEKARCRGRGQKQADPGSGGNRSPRRNYSRFALGSAIQKSTLRRPEGGGYSCSHARHSIDSRKTGFCSRTDRDPWRRRRHEDRRAVESRCGAAKSRDRSATVTVRAQSIKQGDRREKISRRSNQRSGGRSAKDWRPDCRS